MPVTLGAQPRAPLTRRRTTTAPQSAAWLDAARLVRRTGFGATGTQVDAALRLGTDGYVMAALQADPTKDPGAIATPPPEFENIRLPGKDADPDLRKAARKQLRAQLKTLVGWWIGRMATVEQPMLEKLTFCWHNHFATSAAKVRSAPLMLRQNQTLRAHALGDFHALAQVMLVDPAMLRWLDGNKNVEGSPNENLSREFMELFALGHGNGYTEADVREGARALTGWTYRKDGTVRLRRDKHDSTSKTVLGITGNLDQNDFCDAVLGQPAAASYVAGRLYGQLVAMHPSAQRAAELGEILRADWDVAATVRAMLTAEDFSANRNALVVTPVEWLIGAVRALRVPLDRPPIMTRLAMVLKQLGQLPFYPPSVGGWPPGPAWLSTAAAEIRMRTAQSLVKAGSIDAIRSAGTADRIDATAYLLGVGAFSARSIKVLADHRDDPARLVTVALSSPEYLTS